MSRRPDGFRDEPHDVRNCLCLIHGYVQLARRGITAGTLDSDAIIRCLDIALEQVDLVTDHVDTPSLKPARPDREDRILGDISMVRSDMSQY